MDGMERFPTDWSRALAIVAHPDDVEYGAAAAVARWTSEGKSVGYVMITSGERGIEGMAPEECGPLREREQLESAAIVGVSEVVFLRHPDFVLENTPELRADLVRLLREHRPEVVVTLNFQDNWNGEFPNSTDHMNAGQAILDSVAQAPDAGVRWVAAASSPQSTHAEDVSGFEDVAIASLRAHRAYLDGLGGEEESLDMVRTALSQTGQQLGVASAVPFELIEIS
jgi:LmbE family N-acetylglucosaminyl deacetylase